MSFAEISSVSQNICKNLPEAGPEDDPGPVDDPGPEYIKTIERMK